MMNYQFETISFQYFLILVTNFVSQLPFYFTFGNFWGASGRPTEPESPKEEDHPGSVAETVFRDLVCRASYGNINAVIRPVLMYVFYSPYVQVKDCSALLKIL